MAVTRRTAPAVGMMIVVLAACGGTDDDADTHTAASTPVVTTTEAGSPIATIDGEALAGVAFDVRRDPG